ncbi:CobW family GTP-binding protein [Nocardia camponoti]|uniref:Cobalamin biosynthesis protein CobW n=1 Tax=Nocardia camponoti TaxID=1616106 RepID=A0A917V6E6_9NOCA|nr:GTP-binding protein [Nocardia camponoti]GGK44442.1 cobalamin biosynthesis protein CobW [Nocardia camponoti]
MIPVVIVAGYLGSGKTTLLNHLLRAHRGTRIGVIVNDFGSVNIDAMLVAGQVDAMVSLANGCVCCAVDVSELDAMFTKLSQGRNAVDVIVVEASGLAEPRGLIRMVLASENPRLTYGGLVEVVDAEHFSATSAEHPELLTHLRLADLVLINKADRTADLDALRAQIADAVGDVPIYATTHGQIDPGLLFDQRTPEAPKVAQQLSFDLLTEDDHDHRDPTHRHLHDDYTTCHFQTDQPLDPRAFVEFLENPPANLFRAKGFAHFAGDNGKFTVHLVGHHIVFTPDTWARNETPSTDLVLIGPGLDVEEARNRLRATESQTDTESHTDTDNQAMLSVWRYTPR